MFYQGLIREVEDHVRDIFRKTTDHRLLYHNIGHTLKVVEYTKEIASFYQLDEESFFIVLTAAWFHDTGHLFPGASAHELRSVSVMDTFLETRNLSKTIRSKIAAIIMATNIMASPNSFLDKII